MAVLEQLFTLAVDLATLCDTDAAVLALLRREEVEGLRAGNAFRLRLLKGALNRARVRTLKRRLCEEEINFILVT